MAKWLITVTLLFAGCARSEAVMEDSQTPAGDAANSRKPKATHVIVKETEYYTSGPQQGRPPDGTFPVGTRVTLLEQARPYSRIRTESGMVAFVATAALRAIAEGMHTVVTGNNEFALDLYTELSQSDGNFFFSPSSLSTALAMTYAGARGETAEEMARTLHFKLPQEKLHSAFASLRGELLSKPAGYELTIANRLWGQQDYGFLPEFVQVTREKYEAELAEVDFVKQADAARLQINEWVEEQTQEKIKDLIPSGAVDSLTRLVLTNAIYFKGKWKTPFEKEATRDAPFHLTAKDQTKVPMMHQEKHFPYKATEELQILELPYSEEGRLSMIVLLPKEVDGLAKLEKKLSREALQKWTADLRSQKVRVDLPRFKMESQFVLNSVLASLGMPQAFSASNADFSGISTRENLYLSAALHKAYVDVNEEGTEAAAATGIVVGTTSVGPEPPVFRADHPFVFFIRDNRTQSILFLGRLVNPVAE